jgi:hypothetical protein
MLDSPVSETRTIWEDNQSIFAYSRNEMVSDKTKHIDVKFYFVKDHVEQGTTRFKYLPNDVTVEDTLTWPLPRLAMSITTTALMWTIGPMNRHVS